MLSVLTRAMRIAIALEQCEPNKQVVRVPWSPLTDHYEINRLFDKFVKSGRDMERSADEKEFLRMHKEMLKERQEIRGKLVQGSDVRSRYA